MSQSNNPRRSQLRDNHQRQRRLQLVPPVSLDPQPPHPRVQRQDATVRSPILEAIAAEVEEARWAALANQYMALFDQNDRPGTGARAHAFFDALAGDDHSLAELIGRQIRELIERDPVLYMWRDHEDGIVNPPPPYTAHPTKGEITVEMSPEVVLPEYTPPYTPFGQDLKWQTEAEDEEDESEVMEDDEEAASQAIFFLLAFILLACLSYWHTSCQ